MMKETSARVGQKKRETPFNLIGNLNEGRSRSNPKPSRTGNGIEGN